MVATPQYIFMFSRHCKGLTSFFHSVRSIAPSIIICGMHLDHRVISFGITTVVLDKSNTYNND